MQESIQEARPLADDAAAASGKIALQRHWLTFLAPFAVFLLIGAFEPTESKPGGSFCGLSIGYAYYPAIYTTKVFATLTTIIAVFWRNLVVPFRISTLAVCVGAFGALIWIGVCSLHLERTLLEPIGLGSILGLGERAGFNPLEQLSDTPAWAWTFLLIRFVGLVVVVPIVEEFFLRGFLMRYVIDEKWWNIPFGSFTTLAIITGTVVPVLMHPAELFAAAIWFSLVTWLMIKTRNIWDCVCAHAVTNLLLGLYVVWFDKWELM